MDRYFEVIVPEEEYEAFTQFIADIGGSIEAEHVVTD